MKIYLCLCSVLLAASCKLFYLNVGTGQAETEKTSEADFAPALDVVKEKNVGSKPKAKQENKALGKDILEKMAEEVKEAASAAKGKVLGSKTKDGSKIPISEVPSLVSQLKETSRKIEKAISELISLGYSAADALKDNLKTGISSICLLDQILEVAKENGQIKLGDNEYDLRDKVKGVIEEFKKKEECLVAFSLKEGPKKNSEVIKECVSGLMGKVESLFGDSKGNGDGVAGELMQASKSAEKRFSKPLSLIREAVCDITQACKRLIYDL
ncbi:hypothetical protein F0310_05620 (plasmid) [Borrelia sp. A-FGy1]|uniref:hypothetical protein n=1 Tax=Borrelia sp. A-FGy1 TaxID=2608247 RepID=UPI0015F737EC|nr:hypothetical protein [Borrelia sp. A-FGy1]QMU99886.1 hypothetical protein F0310_05620 [Borrelia sp. A-FGy1]